MTRLLTPTDDWQGIIQAAPTYAVFELTPGTYQQTGIFTPPDGVTVYATTRNTVTIDANHHRLSSSARDVTFGNIRFTGYDSRRDPTVGGNLWQRAYINNSNNAGLNWTFHSCDLIGIYARSLNLADGMTLYDCRFTDMGVLGLGGGGVNIAIVHCEFSNNNTSGDGTAPAEEGAMKLVNIADSVVMGCYVHDDTGGIWVDVETTRENHNLYIVGNLCDNIPRPGIHHEISHNALITRNRIRNCGYGKTNWVWGGGILISSSAFSVVRDNIIDARTGGNGITIVNQSGGLDNANGAPGGRKPGGYFNGVYDNDILYSAVAVTGFGTDAKDPAFWDGPYYAGGNTYQHNRHWVPVLGGFHYVKHDGAHSFANWQSDGQDSAGSEDTLSNLPPELDSFPAWSLNNDYQPPPTVPVTIRPGRPTFFPLQTRARQSPVARLRDLWI